MNVKIRKEVTGNEKKELIRVGRFTIVKVMEEGDSKLCGIGISRRSEKDKINDSVAQSIAEGRAIKALALKKQGRAVSNLFMG